VNENVGSRTKWNVQHKNATTISGQVSIDGCATKI
jgi:hypothetical protein